MPEALTPNLKSCTICKNQYPEGELVRYQNELICVNCKGEYFQRIREGLETPMGSELAYSSISRRFWAMMLDGLILGIVQIILNVIFIGSVFGTALSRNVSSAAVGGSVIVFVLSVLFGIAYYVFFLGWKGATPAKMLLGIKVVRPNGTPIGYGRAFLRYIGMMISGCILLIGYIMAIFDDEKRALHDRIASTRVIYS